MTDIDSARLIDHLVLPVANIDVARERYENLGFVVAPDGKHPFGTENCCIFFKDGTFLEPLGIAHRETCEAKALKGNSFVANDQAYRFRRGIEGFSHLVLKSVDAKADDKLFKKSGFSGGKMVRFGRSFKTPAGESGRVSFHLAFAADKRSPDSGFFTCEVKDPPQVDRSPLMAHENGVVGLKEVVLSEPNPTDFQYFLQVYLNQRHMEADSFGMSFAAGNGQITVLSPEGLNAFYGLEGTRLERGMRFEAFVLAVENLANMKAMLDQRSIGYRQLPHRLVVDAAPGQGAAIVFEEQ